MSDPYTKPRPTIDLQEFESRLRQPGPANQNATDVLTELLQIIGGQDELYRTESQAETRRGTGEAGEQKEPGSQEDVIRGKFTAIEAGLLGGKEPQAASLPEAERSKTEYKSPNLRVPLLSGDFAAIEAGLLGPLPEQAATRVSGADVSNALRNVDLRSERWLHQDKQPGSRLAGAAELQRSRRPLYATVAIVIAGTAGMIMSSGLKSQDSDPSEIATIKAQTGSAALGLQTTSGAHVLALDAAIPSKPPKPSPVAFINNSEQPVDLPQAEEKTPLVVALIGSRAPSDSGPAAAPAQAQAQTPAEPLGTVASGDDKVKDDLIRPDGTPLPDGRPSQGIAAPVPLQHPPAAPKAQRAKIAARGAKTPKRAVATAAAKTDGDGAPRQNSIKAKTNLAGPNDAASAPVAAGKAEAAATQPSPPSTGAQTAMKSLTSTTAKLLEWGGIETGSRP
jgi:hypothetical protein